ncbi:MAG: T9SS type A sorting domain-containing protein, partial [Bacteroidia bacterium]
DEYIPAEYVAPANASMTELLNYPDRDSIQKLPHYLYYTSGRFAWLVNFTFGSPDGLNPRWDRITNDLRGQSDEIYTCMTAAEDGTNTIYIGTSQAKIFRIQGATDFENYVATKNGANVIEVTSNDRVLIDYSLTMFGRWITDIAVNPDNPEQIVVTFAGYGGPDPLGYVWYINNVSGSNPEYFSMFPGPGTNDFEQAYSAEFVKDPQTGETVLLVGTESGLYSTREISEQPTWTTELPSEYGFQPVYDIFVRKYNTVIVDDRTGDFRLKQDNTVFVASHGNGVWSTTDLSYAGRDGEEEGELVITDPFVRLYPNPSEQGSSAKIAVELPADAQINTAVYSLDGRRVMQLNTTGYLSGKHEIDLPAQGLLPGIYIVEVQISDAKQTITHSTKWVIK